MPSYILLVETVPESPTVHKSLREGAGGDCRVKRADTLDGDKVTMNWSLMPEKNNLEPILVPTGNLYDLRMQRHGPLAPKSTASKFL